MLQQKMWLIETKSPRNNATLQAMGTPTLAAYKC